MRLLNFKTGKLEVVADPQAAIINGTHGARKSDKFAYVSPDDGGVYEAPGSDLFDVLSKGARLETPAEKALRDDEARYGNRPVEAALTAAAGSASFGLIPAAANILNPGRNEEVAKVQQFNQAATATGDIGGVLIPALFSGGTSLIGTSAKAASAAPRAVAAGSKAIAEKLVQNRLGQKVLGNTLEGAAYGLGKSINEASLGNPTDVAENLLIGSAFGGGLTLGAAALKGASKIVDEKSRKAAAAVINFTSNQKQDAFKFLGDTAEAKGLRDLVLKGKDGLKDLQLSAVEIAKQNADLAKESATLFKTTKFAKAAELLDGVDFLPAKAQVESVQKQGLSLINKMRTESEIYGGPFAAQLEKELDSLGAMAQKAETPAQLFQALDDAKSALQNTFRGANPVSTAEKNALQEVRNFGDSVRGLLENEQAWGKAGAMQQRLNAAYTEFGNASKDFQKTFMRKLASGAEIDPSKVSTLIGRAGKPGEELKLRIFNDYVESSNRLRSVLAEYGAPTIEGKVAQETLHQKVKDVLNSSQAMQEFKDLKGGIRVPVLAGWLPVMVGPSAKSVVNGLAWAEKQAAKVNKEWLGKMSDAAKSLSRTAPLAIKSSFFSEKEVQQEMEDVKEMASNLSATTEAVNRGLSDFRVSAPETTVALEQRTAQNIAFLASKLPKEPSNGLFVSNENWKPTPAEMSRFARYARAAKNPMILLDEVQNGALTPETVETVKQLYPQFYNKTVSGLGQYIAEKKITIPRSKLAAFSMLFGVPLTESSKGTGIMALQQNFAQQNQPVAPTGSLPNIAGAFQTPGQKMTQ
jgi:hypothetical protein